MSVLKAVYQVLKDSGQPLHYQELTKKIIEDGLWKPQGKTPAATVNAQLATEIIKHGDRSKFVRARKGVFGLRENKSSHGLDSHPTSPTTLSFSNAAENILETFGNRKPMHYRVITSMSLKLKLITTLGRTPEATMYAQILSEIQRAEKRGKQPRFSRHGKGYIGLTKWIGKGLAFEIDQHNNEVRKKLLAKIRKMEPKEFEDVVGQLLTAMGFEQVEVTGRSGDSGIDVRGTLVVGDVVRIKMAVQAKRWKNNVHSPVIQQVRGSLGTHEHGLVITTSDFSPGARNEAQRSNAVPVALMNGEDIVSLLIENDLGVTRTSHNIIELARETEG